MAAFRCGVAVDQGPRRSREPCRPRCRATIGRDDLIGAGGVARAVDTGIGDGAARGIPFHGDRRVGAVGQLAHGGERARTHRPRGWAFGGSPGSTPGWAGASPRRPATYRAGGGAPAEPDTTDHPVGARLARGEVPSASTVPPLAFQCMDSCWTWPRALLYSPRNRIRWLTSMVMEPGRTRKPRSPPPGGWVGEAGWSACGGRGVAGARRQQDEDGEHRRFSSREPIGGQAYECTSCGCGTPGVPQLAQPFPASTAALGLHVISEIPGHSFNHIF